MHAIHVFDFCILIHSFQSFHSCICSFVFDTHVVYTAGPARVQSRQDPQEPARVHHMSIYRSIHSIHVFDFCIRIHSCHSMYSFMCLQLILCIWVSNLESLTRSARTCSGEPDIYFCILIHACHPCIRLCIRIHACHSVHLFICV